MNERLKAIREYQKKSSARRKDGVFVVEGIKMALELPEERLVSLVLSESFLKAHPAEAETLRQKAAGNGASFHRCSDEDFGRISDTKSPQGVLAVLRSFSYTEEEILKKENGLFIILENLQDPGNLGTIFRAGEAAGVDGVILSEGSADPYNPKVIRSTMGAFFRMRFAVTSDLPGTVRKIRESGGAVYAAHLSESVDYDEPDYRKKTAFLIGNESAGLTDEITELVDGRIKIPMEGEVESLNAAMAATILMFEAKRQRRK